MRPRLKPRLLACRGLQGKKIQVNNIFRMIVNNLDLKFRKTDVNFIRNLASCLALCLLSIYINIESISCVILGFLPWKHDVTTELPERFFLRRFLRASSLRRCKSSLSGMGTGADGSLPLGLSSDSRSLPD